MAFMVWDSKYELGIPEMDDQHKKWLSYLNKFYDHLMDEGMNNKLKQLLDDAIDYTNFHFKEEERFMASIQYHDLDVQKNLHLQIQAKMLEYKEKLSKNQLTVSTPITTEMKKWFNEHILGEDAKYGIYYTNLTKKIN